MNRRRLLIVSAGALLMAAIGMLFRHWQAEPDFEEWLATGTHAAHSARYQRYLATQGVGAVLPLPQLLSARRDAARCHTAPWQLPPASLWPRMVPTLRLLRELQRRHLLGSRDSITSAYRDAALNACAGGRSQSRHLGNNALDIHLRGQDREARLAALCHFWRQQGARYAFGLGFYVNGQIHIDSGGYRSWGQDYTGRSSPCQR